MNKFFRILGNIVATIISLSFLISLSAFAVWFVYSVLFRWLVWQ